MNDDIRKDLDSLDGQTIVLPNNVRVYVVDGAGNETEVPSAKWPTFKVIECNGDAFEAYQDTIERASYDIAKGLLWPPFIEGNAYANAAHVLSAKVKVDT